MKKEIKKKIINTSIATTVVAAVVAPVAIALADNDNSLKINDLRSTGDTSNHLQSGTGLAKIGTWSRLSSGGNLQVNAYNQESFTTHPYSVVLPLTYEKDNWRKAKFIASVRNNNPCELNWYVDVEKIFQRVYGNAYNPNLGGIIFSSIYFPRFDSVIVGIINDGPYSQDYSKHPAFFVIRNVSREGVDLDLTDEILNDVATSVRLLNDATGVPGTWTMTPVFQSAYDGEEAGPREVLVFNKFSDNSIHRDPENRASRNFFLIDLDQMNVRKIPKSYILDEDETDHLGIFSLAAIKSIGASGSLYQIVGLLQEGNHGASGPSNKRIFIDQWAETNINQGAETKRNKTGFREILSPIINSETNEIRGNSRLANKLTGGFQSSHLQEYRFDQIIDALATNPTTPALAASWSQSGSQKIVRNYISFYNNNSGIAPGHWSYFPEVYKILMSHKMNNGNDYLELDSNIRIERQFWDGTQYKPKVGSAYAENNIFMRSKLKDRTSPVIAKATQNVEGGNFGGEESNGGFAAIIEDPGKGDTGSIDPTYARVRSFFMKSKEDSMRKIGDTDYNWKNNKYINPSTSNDPFAGMYQNNAVYSMGLFGIPIMQYQDPSNQTADLTKNLYVVSNNSSSWLAINNNDRGQDANSFARYGWATRPTGYNGNKWTVTGQENKDVDTVDAEHIKNLLKLNSRINDVNSNDFLNNMIFNALEGNVSYGVVNVKIESIGDITRPGSASVSFDLVTNAIYTNEGAYAAHGVPVGSLKTYGSTDAENAYIGDPAMLIGRYVIEGFKPINKSSAVLSSRFSPTDETKQAYNLVSATNWHVKPTTIYPSILKQVWGSQQANENKVNSFKELVWLSIVSDGFYKGTENAVWPFLFRNIKRPTYMNGKNNWLEAFNDFFSAFNIAGFNSAEGSVNVNVTVRRKYLLGYDNDQSFNNLTISGLKISKVTKFKNQNSLSSPKINNAWSDRNLPQNEKFDNWPTNLPTSDSTVKFITEDELKTYIFETMIKSAYDNATDDNGYDASNEYVDGLVWGITALGATNGDPSNWRKLTAQDLELSNFDFYPADGIVRVDVRLKAVFSIHQDNTNGGYRWSIGFTPSDTNPGTENVREFEYGRYYIGGFRTDNILTNFLNTKDDGIWHLQRLENVSIADLKKGNAEIWRATTLALFECLRDNNYLKLPFWVSFNEVFEDGWIDRGYWPIVYDDQNLIDVDVAKGTATIKIKLRNHTILEDGNTGKIFTSASHNFAKGECWEIRVDGFRNVSPVVIDSSHVWNLSEEVFNSINYLDPSIINDFAFIEKITAIENKIEEYISQKDTEQNLAGAIDLDNWRKRLTFQYQLETPDGSDLVSKERLISKINDKIVNKPGKLGHLYNKSLSTGIKIWIRINDNPNNAEGTSDVSVQFKPTDENAGKNEYGLISTNNVCTDLDMTEWFNEVSRRKGTEIISNDPLQVLVDSIVPPVLNSESYGKGLQYTEIESILKGVGYRFTYEWRDAEGNNNSSNKLPTNFTYDRQNPEISVRIRRKQESVEPPIYIFGDPSHAIKEKTFTLKLNVRTFLNVDLTSFENMLNNLIWDSSLNIGINSDGTVTEPQILVTIINKWKEFENLFYETNGGADVAGFKEKIKLVYSVNDSEYKFDISDVFNKAVIDGWKEAVKDITKLSRIRFYAPGSVGSEKGTKIQVTAVLVDGVNPNDYGINYVSNKQNVIANHGLGTTYDFSEITRQLQRELTTAAPNSSADNLLGFTPPTVNGIAFEEWKEAMETSLDIKFQFKGSGQPDWFDTTSAVTQVDNADPAVYIRAKAIYNPLYSNELNIKNFATGVTNSQASDGTEWSDGVKLQLNLPIYLQLNTELLNAFVESIKSTWGGNTKNLGINTTIVRTAIEQLVREVISDNNASDLRLEDFAVEFKVNTDLGNADSGSQYIKFTNDFANTIANGSSWESFKNGVYFRLVLVGADDGAANHDLVETTFNADKKYALSVTKWQLFQNTSGQNAYDPNVNPIKFWTGSKDDQLSQIVVNGKSTQQITLLYPSPMFFDPTDGKVYVDQSKRLRVQFSHDVQLTEGNAGYNDQNANWSDTPPDSISAEKYLYARIINNYDDVVYGPTTDGTASAIKLDTDNIKPVIEVKTDTLITNINLEGIINIGIPGAQNNFNRTVLADMEKIALVQAIDVISSREKVEVVYKLSGRSETGFAETDWMNLEQLLNKLEDRQFGSKYFGIYSFKESVWKFSLKASIKSKDPNYNIIDQGTQAEPEGVEISTNGIKTNINIRTWKEYLEKGYKAVVVKSSRTARAIVNIEAGSVLQPKAMEGSVDSAFLEGRTFDEISTHLSQLGATFSYSTDSGDNKQWSTTLSQIRSFDDSKNKLWIKINSETNGQITFSSTTDPEQEIIIELNIQHPKTLTIDRTWINEFINSPTTLSGNTKYLNINADDEQALLDKIINAPENQPVEGNPGPVIKVQYRLGQTGLDPEAGWQEREAFIQSLSEATEDATTNKIEFRFIVVSADPEKPLYAVSKEIYELSPKDISVNAKIKIFVNQKDYETLADGVSTTVGSNKSFDYEWNNLPVDPNTGQLNVPGLRLQWTIDKTATYQDPADSSLWSNTKITEIHPTEKYLAIRIIALDGYVYGATYNENGHVPNPEANLHVVNTDNIRGEISAKISTLPDNISLDGLIKIGLKNSVNEFDLNALKQMETAAIEAAVADEKSRNVVKVTYKLIDPDKTESEWIDLEALIAKLDEEVFSNSSFGIISFVTGQYSLKVTLESKDSKYAVIDELGGAQAVQEGKNVTRNNIKTQVNINNWTHFLSNNDVDVVLKNQTKANVNIGAEGKILKPKDMPAGDTFLAGRTFDEIVDYLSKLGATIQFSTNETDWVPSIDRVTSFDNTVNKLWMKITSNVDGQVSFTASTTPGASEAEIIVEMNINFPKTITVKQEWIDAYKAANPLSGNTKYLTIDITKENDFIQTILTAPENQPAEGKPAPNIWIEYRLGKSGLTANDGWETRDQFIESLRNSNEDASTNKIEIRFKVDPVDPNAPLYAITEKIYELSPENISADANIKVFINTNYEQAASGVSVTGISDEFTYNWNNLPVDPDTNRWTARGLKLQWTIDKTARYQDPANDPKWLNDPITEIHPTDKYLAIRIIALDGYVYGADYTENGHQANPPANFHVVDTSRIAGKIEVNIKSLTANVNLAGLVKIGLRNSANEFDLDALKQMETAAIAAAVTDEQSRNVVKVLYQLNGPGISQAQWMPLDELLVELNKKEYGNSAFGIISFINGQYTLKATIKAIDPTANTIYDTSTPNDPINSSDIGVSISGANIKTQIDIEEWKTFLIDTKVPVVKRKSTRAIANIGAKGEILQPKDMPGNIADSFLAGRSFNDITARLTSLGATFAYSVDNQQTWEKSLDRIKKFDDSINKLWMRITWDANAQVTFVTESQTPEIIVEMNIQYPKTLTINETWINEFRDSLPLSGNTKYLSINEASETALIDKIVADNPAVGNDPEPTVWVEYRLGEGQWAKRQEFINNLRSSNVDATTNKIEIRLQVDPVNKEEPIYVITEKIYELSPEDISANANVKIFVNEKDYETLANGVSVEGINDNFEYNYNGLQVSGSQLLINGLKLQWTTDKTATYKEANGWEDAPVTKIHPVDKYLAIKIIAKDGYVYGADYTQNSHNPNPVASIHKVNTDRITSKIEANIKSLKTSVNVEGIIKIGLDNSQNDFNAVTLRQMETTAIETAVADAPSRQYVAVEYMLIGPGIAQEEWLNLDNLLTKLEEKLYGNNSTFGIISFINKQYSLKARLVSTNEKFNIFDTATNSLEAAKKGVDISGTNIKTQVNISNWTDYLTDGKKVQVVSRARRTVREIINLEQQQQILQPKAMLGGVSDSFLAGRSFDDITAQLTKFGATIEYSVDNQNWKNSLKKITSFDNEINKLWMRITSDPAGQVSFTTANNPEAEIIVVMNIQYPKSLVVEQTWIDEYKTSLPLSGNTKYLAIDETKENALIQKIKDANPPVGNDPEPTVWVEYRLGNGQWAKRQEFIDTLRASDVDATTNKIEMRLVADPSQVDAEGAPIYQIKDNSHVLSAEDISASANIKIFVNEKNYEELANGVSVHGINDNFTYNYNGLPVNNSGLLNVNGIKLQWTIDDTATYDDANGWEDKQIKVIHPTKKYLAIKIIAKDGYVYGASYTQNGHVPNPQADIHVVDTIDIKGKIVADINSLATNVDIRGLINVGLSNSANDFDRATLRQMETAAIAAAVKDEESRNAVRIIYKLSGPGIAEPRWIFLDDLLTELNNKFYDNSALGIISFVNGQYTLDVSLKSVNEGSNVVDETNPSLVETGVRAITDKIKTKVNISAWTKFLKDNKVLVVDVNPALAINKRDVDLQALNKVLQPQSMPGNTADSFLAGRTFKEITAQLSKLGARFEFSVNNQQWFDSLDQIKSFDNSINKLWMKITSNIDGQVTFTTTDAPEGEILVEMNIKWPKSLIVEQAWIDEYKNSIPLSGNTKYLTIDAAKEQTLINQIVQGNPPAGSDPVPNVWIEYRLGNGSGEWLKRDAFIKSLRNSNVDATTNQIEMKLVVDPSQVEADDPTSPIYQIENSTHVLSAEEISASANIKIFVHQKDYETSAEGVSISGTNTNFTYNYGNLPVDPAGLWTGSTGLKVQWTTDETATYQDPADDPKWLNTPADNIDVRERYLAIRIIALDGYIYGADYADNGHQANPAAAIHIVNVDNIKSEVIVNLEDLKTNLQFNGYANEVDLVALKESEQKVLGAINGGEKLAIKYKVTLSDGSSLSEQWMTAEELNAALNAYSTDYTNASQGLIKFQTSTNANLGGATIQATFVSLDDKFIPLDPNNDVSQGIQVNTDNIKTKVDLTEWFKQLAEQPTSFNPGSTSQNISGITPPGMPNAAGTGFMAGMTYEQIIALLQTVGIEVEFQAPGSTTQDNWVPLDQINNLNNANELFIRFKVQQDWASSVEIINNGQIEDNAGSTPIQLKINLPLTIKVDPMALKQLAFKGTTKELVNFDEIKAKEAEIITAAKEASKTGNASSDALIDKAEIVVKYRLVGSPTRSQEWLTLDEVKQHLETSRENFTSNMIEAKYEIINNPIIEGEGTPQYQLSTEEVVVINEEQYNDASEFKVYIYSTDDTNSDYIFQNYFVEGTQEIYTINNLNVWLENINNLRGLEIEFNATNDGTGNPTEDGWKTTPDAGPIDQDRNYWVRFKVKPGYVFENAVNGAIYSAPIKLDASRVKVTIKIESAWLEQVALSGNTKNLQIDETNALALVSPHIPSGVDPTLIKIQYTVDGVNWYTKDKFIEALVALDGGISDQKWIILREDIKARFVLDSALNATYDPQYGLQIDGQAIIEDSQSPVIQLIDDAKNLNTGVKGYINANKLTPFVVENFWVGGTNTKAVLHTFNADQFNQMLDGYKSLDIFEMLYTWDKNLGYLPENKVWDPNGNGVVEELRLNGNYSNSYFAVVLKSKSDKYDVYHDDVLQTNGYELSTESNPGITIAIANEIVNPLIGKTVLISYLNNKQPVWYQSNGAFFVKIQTDDGRELTFREFLDSIPDGTGDGQLPANHKEALELAYYVADHELTSEEYAAAVDYKKIQPPKGTPVPSDKYSVWRSLPEVIDESTNFNLSVNDYVIVALRVKEEYLADTSKPGISYIMKDNEHTPSPQSRVYGYKVHTAEIDVNWNKLEVKNVNAPVQTEKCLDGYGVISNISLVEDANKNYQGVDLKLNYFNDFYRNQNNEPLVSASGDRLVKRSKDGATQGNNPYTDALGNPIVDKDGNQVYPWLVGIRPSDPVKENAITRDTNLVEVAENSFRFDDSLNLNIIEYSLFANQYIQIQYMNKKGKATAADEYDYYVDQENVVEEFTIGTDRIKYLISNPKQISYQFNGDFKDKVESGQYVRDLFENQTDPTQPPKNGESKFKQDTFYGVFRKAYNEQDQEINSLDALRNKLNEDFNGQVKLITSIRRRNQNWEAPIDYGNLSDYSNLNNGDYFRIEIVPTNDDFVFAQQDDALTFQVRGLQTSNAQLVQYLQYLRVEQKGQWNGEGTFRIYFDNPNDPNDDSVTIEQISESLGIDTCSFKIRVWGTDANGLPDKTKPKHDWTSDLTSINDLRNGDKVEWALFAAESTPEHPFYNTVADVENTNAPQNIYKFIQINRKNLVDITDPVPQPDNQIGAMPQSISAYPENSGFIINNLEERDQNAFTTITESEFNRVMTLMNFSYSGVNTKGNMISSQNTTEVIVNTANMRNQQTQFTLQYLIDNHYVSFFYGKESNGLGVNGMNEFAWNQVKDSSGNWLTAPGLLSNGDKIVVRYDDGINQYFMNLPDVSGLSQGVADNMPMFVWVGVAAAGVATLGIFVLIYFLARNRKLKK